MKEINGLLLTKTALLLLLTKTNMHFLMIMNLLMTWIILWYCKVDLFYSEFLKIEPSKVSNKKILKTFKTVTITECWLNCKQTDDCKSIGTATDRDERIITCYLLESEEKLLN